MKLLGLHVMISEFLKKEFSVFGLGTAWKFPRLGMHECGIGVVSRHSGSIRQSSSKKVDQQPAI